MRRQGRARRLVVGAETYLWSVRHIHRPERCAERLTLRRRGSHGHLRVTFEAGPGHYVPDGWLHSGAVATEEESLNLHEPGTARAFLDVAMARGWDPAEPAGREVDGWELFDAAHGERSAEADSFKPGRGAGR